jgi:hypothetical protein
LFISFIFGKASGQIIRIAGAVKAVNSAIAIMGEYKDHSKIMDETYYQFIVHHTYNPSIGILEIKIAAELVDYFLHQKLNLVGLMKIDKTTYEWAEDDAIRIRKSADSYIPDTLERKILLSYGSDVFLTQLSSQKICKKDEFEKACSNLTLKKLGQIDKKIKPSSKPSNRNSLCFTKVDLAPLDISNETTLEILDNILSFQINIDEYKQNFLYITTIDLENADESNDSSILTSPLSNKTK